jgi:hypothetical protein
MLGIDLAIQFPIGVGVEKATRLERAPQLSTRWFNPWFDYRLSRAWFEFNFWYNRTYKFCAW